MALFGRKRKRALVVGLDGVPYTLLSALAADGTMPNMAKLISLGHLSKMKVTLPEISAVSWPSFMTGADPGTHGIFGFVDPKPGSYDIRFPSFRDLKAPTFWDRLGERKKKSVVINQPSTYPAREIPGVLISGFVAISLKKAVWPPRVLDDLTRMDYRIDIDTARAREDHDYLLEDLDITFDRRVKAIDHLWKNEEWDYFQAVITGTDRLQHYIWEAYEDASHKHHDAFLDYYRKVDGLLAQLWERFNEVSGHADEGEGFFLLSDHGFCGIKQEVRINRWLMDNGYLSFETEDPASMEDISESSTAFAVDPGRIYLNRTGRFPKGSVDEGSARTVAEEIKSGLAELAHDGETVIERVFERDEVYSGPQAKHGPDLLPVGHHGFDLKGTIKEPDVFGRTNLTGMHTWDDAFFWSLRGAPDDLHITQLAEIVTTAVL
jgi:predicted AlkP superfamily phosphohydrolase/phosphomutase